MLSYPDFAEKQLIFIHCEWGVRSSLSILNRNVVYKKDGEVAAKVSLYKIFVIFVMGDVSLTTKFIAACQEYGVSIILMKQNFNVITEVISQAEGNFLLRHKQYMSREEDDLRFAKILVENKVCNQLKLMCSVNNSVGAYKELKKEAVQKIRSASDRYELSGIEGSYARKYFSVYFAELDWWKRAPRTRVDIPNVLMDIGYTQLFYFVEALLRVHGFDTYKGCYHQLFYARKSLACDIMEPFRPVIDRAIRKMYTLGILDQKDFSKKNGMYELSWALSKKYNQYFLQEIMNQKEEIFGYVRKYYRHTMNSEDNKFPQYRLIARV